VTSRSSRVSAPPLGDQGDRRGVPWLNDEEQAAWRGFLSMHARVTAKLNRDMSASCGLSLQDYAVLVALTDRPDGRLRPFELGRELGWEKSRLSHHISRMVERGLVARETCPADQRGWLVTVTDRGREAIEAAAPEHAAAVRRIFVDLLTPAELVSLIELSRRVLAACDAQDEIAG
jgi:DNA-binding MarR family transcriptional regulator